MLDGIFSWEAAWPDRGGFGGQYPGDVSADVKVFAGAKERDVAYMMGNGSLPPHCAVTNISRSQHSPI